MEHFRLEFESISTNEEFARVVAAVYLSRLNPTLEQADDVKTAVSEAVSNAVIYGYPDSAGVIMLEARIEGQDILLIVSDKGAGIPDVKKAMELGYTTDRTGTHSGMGFTFMEAFMDEVQVESVVNQGTKVVMRKRIN